MWLCRNEPFDPVQNWDLDHDMGVVRLSSNAALVVHRHACPGTHTVALVVQDQLDQSDQLIQDQFNQMDHHPEVRLTILVADVFQPASLRSCIDQPLRSSLNL